MKQYRIKVGDSIRITDDKPDVETIMYMANNRGYSVSICERTVVETPNTEEEKLRMIEDGYIVGKGFSFTHWNQISLQ